MLHWSHNIQFIWGIIFYLGHEQPIQSKQKGKKSANNVVCATVRAAAVISLDRRKDLEEQMDKILQIFEKPFHRKHIMYALTSRAGPKLQKSKEEDFSSHHQNCIQSNKWLSMGRSFKQQLNDHPPRTMWKEFPFWIRACTGWPS